MSPAAPTRASDQEEWISPTLGPGCRLLHHSAQSPDCRVDTKSSWSVKWDSLFSSSCLLSVCVHTSMCVWRPVVDVGYLPPSLPYVLEIGSFIELGTHWLDFSSTFPELGKEDTVPHFSHGHFSFRFSCLYYTRLIKWTVSRVLFLPLKRTYFLWWMWPWHSISGAIRNDPHLHYAKCHRACRTVQAAT